LEKPRRFRTQGGLNEHLGRHESATGPVQSTDCITQSNLTLRSKITLLIPHTLIKRNTKSRMKRKSIHLSEAEKLS